MSVAFVTSHDVCCCCDVSQTRVAQRCGRLVAHASSAFYGVERLATGRRCDITVRFTPDVTQQDSADSEARLMLRAIDSRKR